MKQLRRSAGPPGDGKRTRLAKLIEHGVRRSGEWGQQSSAFACIPHAYALCGIRETICSIHDSHCNVVQRENPAERVIVVC